jgi:OTU domain-containing protein 6
MDSETLDQLQARHRKEQKDLQGRITNKKKNATKKTRKGVNDECAELERQLKDRQEEEIRNLKGEPGADVNEDVRGDEYAQNKSSETDRENGLVNGLESRINGLNISDAPPQETESPINDSAQPPKKRNRQKERLARRAAEQEAAAEAAAAEAASMPDRRGLEASAMRAVFAANRLEEKDIAPDGHCLFAAVADQLGCHGLAVYEPGGLGNGAADISKGEPAYKTVRRVAAAYMTQHPDDFAGFLEEPLEKHVADIRDTAEWGGMLELSALANAYSTEIRVVQNGRTEVISPASGAEEGAATKKIWLAYYRHGYGLGEHYNSLRPAKKAAS